MKNVVMKKEDVLSKVKENRKEHLNIYNESIGSWKMETINVLEKSLKILVGNKKNPWNEIFSAQHKEPVSHEKEYNQAIEMLELEVRNEIELDKETFAQLIQDDWHWQRDFLNSTSNYSVTATNKFKNH